jgi:ADP-ribose pyrophosphatase
MQSPSDVRILDSRPIYDARIFRVVEESVRLPSGLQQDLAIIVHPGAVAIAAQEDSGELLLVRQYRHAVGEWLEEIPAGRLEAGEQPLRAAQRELEEETQRRAGSWTELEVFFPAPGFCSERMSLFLARDLVRIDGGRAQDADEEIEVVSRTPAQILAGGCRDAKTLIAALILSRSPAI